MDDYLEEWESRKREEVQLMIDALLSNLPSKQFQRANLLYSILRSGLDAQISGYLEMREENLEEQVNEETGEITGGAEVVERIDKNIAMLTTIKEQINAICCKNTWGSR